MDDYILIKKILKGDKQAFDDLVRKYYQDIFILCYQRTKNEDLAADLTQDTFLKLVASIYKYQFSGNFKNFLYTIAINNCNDYFRKKEINTAAAELVDVSPLPLDQLIESDEKKDLLTQLEKLPDIQKEALTLYYFHDLKVREIAEIMNVPLATIKSRIKQGRDKLKEFYEEVNKND